MRRIDLGQRPTSREELADWCATALAAQASSGLSVSAYAAQLGVTAATLYQWRRRLACDGDGDHEGLPANLVEVTLARSTLDGEDAFQHAFAAASRKKPVTGPTKGGC